MDDFLKNTPQLPDVGNTILYHSTEANVDTGIVFQHASIINNEGVITAIDHIGVATLEGAITTIDSKYYEQQADGTWLEVVAPAVQDVPFTL